MIEALRRNPAFSHAARLAAGIFGAPSAIVTTEDRDHQVVVVGHGPEIADVSAAQSFCENTLATPGGPVLLIADALADPKYAASPLVTGPDRIRFYTGIPILVHGRRTGTISVFDRLAHKGVSQDEVGQMVELAGLAGALFEASENGRILSGNAAELSRKEWHHALTLEAGRVGSWVWDVPTGDLVANDIFCDMFGLAAANPVHIDAIFSAVNPEDRPANDLALKAAFEDGVDYVCEFRVVSGRWLIGRGRVYQRDAEGKPLIMMGINIDVTEAHIAADHTRSLLRELNHRVKNSLAIIQSLARQTLRESPNPERFIEAFTGRLKTFSEAHTLLADRDWSGVSLIELIRTQASPYVTFDDRQLDIIGADMQLPPDHALGVGLIIHELASNAARYGALRVPEGKVTVSWLGESGVVQRIHLIWQESGGPQVDVPDEGGFGRTLIERGLDKVLDSAVSLSFLPQGVRAEISFPLF